MSASRWAVFSVATFCFRPVRRVRHLISSGQYKAEDIISHDGPHMTTSYSCIARLLADSLIAAVERETNDPRPSEVAEMRAADDKWVAFSFQDATSVLEKTLRVAAKQNKTRIQTGNGIAESVRHPKSVMRRLVHLMKCLSV
jgi:hypothetical protein